MPYRPEGTELSKLGGQWLAGSNPLLEGGGGTPIKQMQRYLSFGVAGEVREQKEPWMPNGILGYG